VSSRAPRRRSAKKPGSHRSPWTYVAPAALLGAVTVIVLISSSAGWIGHPADGAAPPATGPSGPVQTLSVPDTAPPPVTTQSVATVTTPTTPAKTQTATTSTTAATTAATTGATTQAATTSQTATAGSQHVKWTVKQGDTLSSIAAQFGTTVAELERLNPAIDPATLQVGQTLVVR
jgi:LysM repeat protein